VCREASEPKEAVEAHSQDVNAADGGDRERMVSRQRP
jgi:hypothetical protein